jgi:hypothetical protein
MSILGYFAADMVKVTITRPTYTTTDGSRVAGTPTRVWSGKALYWKGAMAQAFVSERFRAQTDGALGLDPSVSVQREDLVEVESTNYKVIDSDNVGAAGEVQHVAMELMS